MRRRHLLSLLPATLAAPALAQAFPERPITLVIPFAPGGSSDAIARLLSERMTPLLGQPVVAENRPGAGGIVASQAVARARPDGHTLLFGGLSAQILVQGVQPNLPFDPVADFAPVIITSKVPLVLVAARQLEVTDAPALVERLRREPGRHNFSSAGNGTSGHISAQHFADVNQLQVTHVPYRGSAAGLADLIAGRISYLSDTPSVVAAQAQAGQLRALAVFSGSRAAALPGVPTFREAGLPQVNNMEPWQAILAPRGTPEPVLARLNAVLTAILGEPEVRARFAAIDLTVMGGSVAEAAAFFRAENDLWVPILRGMGLSAT
ncbi:tripartite tricarboxylate transporter substrate binding protein [Roseococcus sp. SDR]|uniref:Bug family tripartite tricarboxylate transporter substrate binding protein n=1 Tax=Roseococcus sp. SDR TaxID=2835532 RepID=UPI001BCF04EF|nr:tripartite tricarboxylate transporter substrate binding protein [Roseococcus sp. SDR]MBS7790467.1 tripartite tricarboxylate transporter substrate binding protein [Roseococcus sp. SDR]MBV1845781.1 tripartite tricarboxylate transporter substrate binding protein [Roseococcus sp. SDR]